MPWFSSLLATVTTSLWLQLGVVALWVGLVILLAAWLHYNTDVRTEVVRKVVHIGTGNVILLAWWLQIPSWVGIGASIIFTTLTLLSHRFFLLPGIDSVGRKSWGTVFYAISIGVLIAWFWPLDRPQYAALGILVMTWGDGMAALVGQQFGANLYQLWGVQKSWEGSLTMAMVTLVISGWILGSVHGFTWQIGLIALAVALTATSLEAFSKFGIDNLTVPLGSAALSFGLNEGAGESGRWLVEGSSWMMEQLVSLLS